MPRRTQVGVFFASSPLARLMAESLCTPGPGEPCRLTLDIVGEHTALWMYILSGIAFAIFAYGFYQMIRVWRMGTPWKPRGFKESFQHMVTSIATHRKFMREEKAGTMHAWIFYGFMALLFTTTVVAIDADVLGLVFKTQLLRNAWYLGLELFADIFGVLFMVGLVVAIWRRYRERPDFLHRTGTPEAPWLKWMDPDTHLLVFLFLIGLTGFTMEGLRIRHQMLEFGIDYGGWSFVGYAIGLLFEKMTMAQIATVYQPLWWVHFALWTSVLAILPWTKLKHAFTSTLNVFFFDPERQGRADLSKPFDLPAMMESGDMELPVVGVSTIREFTWKDRLSFDACTNCGRCEAQCPAHKAGRPLSPRKLIQDLKAHMWEDYYSKSEEAPKIWEADGVRDQIEEAVFWSCTTCRACMTECPVDINHVDHIVDVRRAMVNESKLDTHQQNLLVNLTNAGNPYGFPAADRDAWTASLAPGIEVPRAMELVASGQEFEYLWFVGCTGSYDPRNQEVTKSIATILNAAGVSFAILGDQERCTGDSARRLGEEGRFQQSVMENMMLFGELGVKKIITQCPHCFNTLANEYPEFGAEWEVIHHTQLIEQLIEAKQLPLQEGQQMAVTYHDSCYLGRHNGIFDAPRKVIEETNGLPVLEMAQSGDQGLCCGAGGANMWYEVEQKDRINVIRAKQAADTGASTVVSACPFCLTMMKDGLDLTGATEEKGMVVEDLAELVVKHLDWTPPEPEVPEDTGAGDDAGEEMVWVG